MGALTTLFADVLNSYLWANAPSWEEALEVPPVGLSTSFGTLSLDAAAASGLAEIRCIAGSVKGTSIDAQLSCDGITAHATGTWSTDWFEQSGDVGLVLDTPVLSVTATVTVGTAAPSAAVSSVKLAARGVDVEVDGVRLPNPVLSELLAALEAAANNPPLQTWIVSTINARIARALQAGAS